MAQTRGDSGLSTVERSFEIVELIAENGEIGVTDLADRLGMNKSTVHTYLRTLTGAGYLVNNDGKYSLSLEFMRLGGLSRDQLDIYREGRREIRQLANDTGELANVGVEERGYVYVVAMAEGERAVHDGAPEGKYTDMHSTAMGKSMLAYMSEDRILDILDEHGLPAKTEHTITDREELFEELQTIRAQGYAIDAQEGNLGIRCVAAPITDSDDEAMGAISVTGPAKRMEQEDHEMDIIQKVTSVANVIEVQFEYS